MRYWFFRAGFALPFIAAIGGCLSLGAGLSPAQPVLHQDHYSLVEGSERSSGGCRFNYRLFEPNQPISPTVVMLGHGFLRNQDRLVELSRSLANVGIRTATLNFCNMKAWNGNHQANGADMRQLAISLGTHNNVIFGGFSAGALAAVLAADERTQAVFALDFVDQAELGATALKPLKIPLIGLHGPPSGCNANNTGRLALEQYLNNIKHTGTGYELVTNASHCEFESPTNWICRTACSDDDPDDENLRTRQFIIDRSVEIIKPYLTPPPS